MISKFKEYLFAGLGTGLILYLTIMPFYIILSKFTLKAIAFYLPLLVILTSVLGFIATKTGFRVLNFLSSFFIVTISKIYKQFLVQSVKYFYPDKVKTSFTKVVEFEISDGITILAFVVNEVENYTTVYIPTSPNPTSGLIFKVSNKKLKSSRFTTDEMIEYTISHGVKD